MNSVKFIEMLFENTQGNIEFRAISSGTEKVIGRLFSRDYQKIGAFIKEHRPHSNIYFGVCTRKPNSSSGKKTDCFEVPGFWADLDFKDYSGGEAEAREILSKFPIKPTIIVRSGGGLHTYWKFKEPEQVGKNGAKYEALLRGLNDFLHADRSTGELARMMRVPGTTNFPTKTKKNLGRKEAQTCEIEELSQNRYCPDDFEIFTNGTTEPESKTSLEFEVCDFDNVRLKLKKDLKSDKRLRESWEGKRTDLKDRSRSGYDMAIASILARLNYSPGEAFEILKRSPSGKGKEATVQYLKHTIKKAFHRLNSSIGDSYRSMNSKANPRPETKPKPKPTAYGKGLIDLVEKDGEVYFLFKENSELTIRKSFMKGEQPYNPPPKETIPYALPRYSEVLKWFKSDNNKNLFLDLIAYHKSIAELPDDLYYDLLAAFDMHTYRQEDLLHSPIICLYAVAERGKTRTGKSIINVAYRGIHVESLRDAYLVRVSSNFNVSIFFDVMNLWKKAEKQGTEDLLLVRFEKGVKVPRVNYPERGPHLDTDYYNIFGPSVVATNEPVHRILETRCVQINMPESDKTFETEVRPELALPFRERLVAFRARTLENPFPEVRKPAQGRLGDILKPILQIFRLAVPEREFRFFQLLDLIKYQRLQEKSESLEAKIILAILDLKDEVERGYLPVKAITDRINNGGREFSYHRVGRILTAIGFKKGKTGSGSTSIQYEPELISRLRERYGLGQTSVSSGSQKPKFPSTDYTCVSDDTELSNQARAQRMSRTDSNADPRG